MFITFEGGEGSGKSTAIKRINELLIKDGYKVVLTREPGGTPISEDIRNIILDKKNIEMDKRTEILLFAASRRQHLIQKIWPALKEGKIVICDRYLDSSLAYQGGARNVDVEDVLKVNLFATENEWPDITFLFDIDPEIGLGRIRKNHRADDRLDNEKMDFHLKVREAFLKLSKQYKDRYVVIDASKSSDEIVNEVYSIIKKKINK